MKVRRGARTEVGKWEKLRILPALRAPAICSALVLAISPVLSEGERNEEARDPLVLIDTGNVRLKGTLSSIAGGMAYGGTWFGLAAPVLGMRYDASKRWAEGWIQPGVELSLKPTSLVEVYGGLSLGLSGTLGRDPYDYRNRGAAWPETAYIGVRTTRPETEINLDLSIGQQPYAVGTGMLLTQGGGNGLERGAVLMAPRVSWANAAIGKVTWRGWSAEAFYLDPNEVPSENTGTKLAGGLVEHKWGDQSRVGAAYISVLASSAPYPIASFPLVVDDARRDLHAWHAWSRIEATAIGLPNTWVRLEGATQANNRVSLKSRAMYGEIGHAFVQWIFSPSFSYGFAYFSGDNRRTAEIERFDPLLYGGGYDNWWFGANSSLAWLNSNVAFHRATAQFTVTDHDVVTFHVVRAMAVELRSPLQFGQGARFGIENGQFVLFTGVTRPHLSDELSVAWNREWSKHITSTLIASVAVPGSGLKALPTVTATTWYGIGAILTLKY